MKTSTTPAPANRKATRPAPQTRPTRLLPNTVRIPIQPKHLNTFKFYARNFAVSVESLMQCEIYAQAACLIDDVFGSLDYFDSIRSTENLETVSLTFSDEAYALLSKVSELLRRPLSELAGDFLSMGATVLADHLSEALKDSGIHACKHLPEWAENAVMFEHAAQRGKVPLSKDGLDCWQVFNIKKTATTKAPAIITPRNLKTANRNHAAILAARLAAVAAAVDVEGTLSLPLESSIE